MLLPATVPFGNCCLKNVVTPCENLPVTFLGDIILFLFHIPLPAFSVLEILLWKQDFRVVFS